MNLVDLQNQFQNQLLSAACTEAAWITENSNGLSSAARLNIYHNAYRVRLAETLRDTFEHTANYITEALFETLAYNYIEDHPSTNVNIGMYGQEFPNFLKRELPSCQEVTEIATMDWLLRRAFDCENFEPLTRNALQVHLAGGGVFSQLNPAPTLSLCTHQHNSLDIWQAVNSDMQAPAANKLPETITILVWRKGTSPHFRSLSPFEAKAVELLLKGPSIEFLCESLSEYFPDLNIAAEFGNLLSLWLDEEMLCSV